MEPIDRTGFISRPISTVRFYAALLVFGLVGPVMSPHIEALFGSFWVSVIASMLLLVCAAIILYWPLIQSWNRNRPRWQFYTINGFLALTLITTIVLFAHGFWGRAFPSDYAHLKELKGLVNECRSGQSTEPTDENAYWTLRNEYGKWHEHARLFINHNLIDLAMYRFDYKPNFFQLPPLGAKESSESDWHYQHRRLQMSYEFYCTNLQIILENFEIYKREN